MPKFKVDDILHIKIIQTDVLVKIIDIRYPIGASASSVGNTFYYNTVCVKVLNKSSQSMWSVGIYHSFDIDDLEGKDSYFVEKYVDLAKKVERCLNLK
jgi:uncharacterized phosphosugar-binding protein